MRGALAASLLCAAGCAEAPGSPEWLVDAPRLLAVQAEPPEAPPGRSAVYRLLAAGPQGALEVDSAQWAVCTAPLPLDESGAVATACLAALPAVAQGDGVSVATSADACSRFGSLASPETQRARDPDATGGYFQPIRVERQGSLAFALARLRCPLAQASLAISREYEQRYQLNRNPVIAALTASAALDGVPAGASLALTLSWDPASVETFPVFDLASLALADQRETMTVSWFTTAGALASARTGSAGSSASTQWTAPKAAGPVYLWAVLRDSRGGLAWSSARATVVSEAP